MRHGVFVLLTTAAGGLCAESLVDQGRDVFLNQAQPACSVCHTLKDAGAVGQIGPDLDLLSPSREQVVLAVTQGVGVMPPFEGSLSAEQIDIVARYVSQVTGGD